MWACIITGKCWNETDKCWEDYRILTFTANFESAGKFADRYFGEDIDSIKIEFLDYENAIPIGSETAENFRQGIME